MAARATDVKSIFGKAMELGSPAERAAYLEEACRDDPLLRDEVESLLKAGQEAGAFFAGLGPSAAVAALEPSAERPGAVIGPYKIMEQIGEGGMGLVFVAEQQQPIRRKVALKVIKPGMDTGQVVARFEAERQALALMDHPNIAKVHDGGQTASGRPYFVMELVKGVPLTDYCDENRLPPRERLELFLQVCQAVQHAHQKGIIHRDLKPSNLLVASQDGVPVVKIIDFGVAKALGQQLTERTLYTQFTQLIGTPLYMSPEQAGQSALDVDTRSDIYSLGVLLYELLTGTTPFDKERLKEVTYDEIRRIIREEEPPRPSTRLSTLGLAATTISAQRQSDPKRLSQLFRGELDWIVMKCLEKDRNRRYETSNDLALDVERYLHDEPVRACPPSALYKLRKFARRKKGALAMAACVFLALAGIAGGVGWAVRDRAARDHDQQVREAALDEEVKRELNQAGTLLEQGQWPEALAAVDRADKLLAAARRADRPPSLLKLKQDLALAQRLEYIHDRPKTEEFFMGQELDAAYAELFAQAGIDVTALSVAEAAERIRTRSIRRELVRALDFWSHMRQRAGSQRSPDWKQLVLIAEAADADPWRNQLRQARRRADRQRLEALATSADFSRLPPQTVLLLANALYESGGTERAMALLREARLHYPDDWWLGAWLGWWCLSAQPPQYDEAIRHYTACQATRPRNAYSLHGIAQALAGKRAYAEAVATYSRAIDLKPDYWDAWWHRAEAYLNLGQRDKALADYSHPIDQNPIEAWAWHKRGWAYAYHEPREYDKAIADFNKALKLNPKIAWSWNHRGWVYSQLHQFDNAVVDLNKAIALDPKLASAWSNRGWVYGQRHQFDQAIADFNKAIKLDPRDAAAWNYRGRVYCELQQFDKAVADLTKAIELDPKLAPAWIGRGWVYACHLHQYGKGVADLTKAIKLAPKDPGGWHCRGWAYGALHQWDQALADLKQAIELDPKHAEAWRERGVIYDIHHQYGKALAHYAQASELNPKLAMYWNLQARLLATCPDAKFRDAAKAVALAKKALEMSPKDAVYWRTLGAARYRAGNWKEAVAALEHSMKLPNGSDSFGFFFLAMAHWQLGNKDQSRRWYAKAVEWLDENSKDQQQNKDWDVEFVRLRAEAEAREVLGIGKKKSGS
jgi:serine/threonine protein kinase/Flp pilus assembly protein TadD